MAGQQRTNFGERPSGWVKVTLDLPEPIAASLRDMREGRPHGALKLIGTAAFSLFQGLDPKVQEALIEWAHSRELKPMEIAPADAFQVLLVAMRSLNRTPLISTENPPKKPVPKGKPGPSPGKGGAA